MEYKEFDILVNEWNHIDKTNAVYGLPINGVKLSYSLGLTPPDPRNANIFYFNVLLDLYLVNEKDKDILSANTTSCFAFEIKGSDITTEDLFIMIKKAFESFAVLFRKMTNGTNLNSAAIQDTSYEAMLSDIIFCLNFWNKSVRHSSPN